MKHIFIKNKKNGYTIIETMIAVSLFIIIVLIGTNALLSANLVHQKSQDGRALLDSVGFAMDELSRNLRTAYTYHCFVAATEILPSPISTLNYPKSCAAGEGMSFETDSGNPSDYNDQEIYYFSEDDEGIGSLWKLSGPYVGVPVPTRLLPAEVELDMSASGFSVAGAEAPGSGDNRQPLVVIRLSGEIKYKNTPTTFDLETSVSQRLTDR